jgi:predicted TIM-barrel fold metal-dependent hydrolase
MRLRWIAVVAMIAALNCRPASETAPGHRPVIDMFLLAYDPELYEADPRKDYGTLAGLVGTSAAGIPNPVTGRLSPAHEVDHMRQTLLEMERHNVVLGVVSGRLNDVVRWRNAAPDRLWGAAIMFAPEFYPPESPAPSIEDLRRAAADAQIQVLGEMVNQVMGIPSNDPRLDPYFALAEELDLPVGIHTGTGPGEDTYRMAPSYRLSLGNPLLLEDVLLRHPRLRVYLMHGGAPWLEGTIAIMQTFRERVYADVSVLSWFDSDNHVGFHAYLRRMIEAGLGSQIMFASEQSAWPDAIGRGIAAVEAATFLTSQQRADILYNNAARFLRLAEDQIRRHHER